MWFEIDFEHSLHLTEDLGLIVVCYISCGFVKFKTNKLAKYRVWSPLAVAQLNTKGPSKVSLINPVSRKYVTLSRHLIYSFVIWDASFHFFCAKSTNFKLILKLDEAATFFPSRFAYRAAHLHSIYP